MTLIYLETSSYLPLIWITPYSRSVIDLIEQRRSNDVKFALQQDCIREAAGYLSFKDDWRYHPAIRIRTILKNLDRTEIEALPYPSTAVQLLLGGNIWPQAQYLNFVRHTAFFFIDLLDDISFEDPTSGLLSFAEKIEERVATFRKMFEQHMNAKSIRLPLPTILPYWGRWYFPENITPINVHIVNDVRPYDLASDKLRDIYHYDCALNATRRPEEMIVANTGFRRNVRAHFGELSLPLACAETATGKFFGLKLSE